MISIVRTALAAAALAALAPAAAAAPPAKPAAPPAKTGAGSSALALPALERFRLDNGLEVAFLPLPGAPAISVQVWYHVGSKDEPRDRRGSAHMFEHMMFKGSQRVRAEDHARSVSRIGGYVNAVTNEDATYYVNVLPADYLDHALALEAERMRNLLFREEMVATEREVVKEEIRQQENNPLAQGLLKFLGVAFSKHPYAWNAGGTIADLDRTTVADLKKFYDTYYVPSNALLVVVGNVDRARVEAAAKKHFAAIPAGAAVPRPADAAAEPAQAEVRRAQVEGGQVGMTLVGYKVPAAKHADIYALQALSLILGNGDSARLVRRIKEAEPGAKAALGIAAGTPILVREHPGVFLTFAAYIDPSKGAAVEAALVDEVKKISARGVTAEELRTAKNQIQASFVFGLQGAAGLGEQIGTSWILTGDPGQFLRDIDEIEKLTVADLQRAARTYLDPGKATIVVVPAKTGK
jgi:zinc protease